MSNQNKFYATSFNLSKLKHAVITSKTGQKCLVIPVNDNYIEEFESPNGMYYYIQADICVKSEIDANQNWGFVRQKLPSKIYKELGSEKSKQIELPFLANLKIFAKSEEINVIDATTIIDPNSLGNDDLPF